MGEQLLRGGEEELGNRGEKRKSTSSVDVRNQKRGRMGDTPQVLEGGAQSRSTRKTAQKAAPEEMAAQRQEKKRPVIKNGKTAGGNEAYSGPKQGQKLICCDFCGEPIDVKTLVYHIRTRHKEATAQIMMINEDRRKEEEKHITFAAGHSEIKEEIGINKPREENTKDRIGLEPGE